MHKKQKVLLTCNIFKEGLSENQIDPVLYVQLSLHNMTGLKSTLLTTANYVLELSEDWKRFYLNTHKSAMQVIAYREFLKYVNRLVYSSTDRDNHLLYDLTYTLLRQLDKSISESVATGTVLYPEMYQAVSLFEKSKSTLMNLINKSFVKTELMSALSRIKIMDELSEDLLKIEMHEYQAMTSNKINDEWNIGLLSDSLAHGLGINQ